MIILSVILIICQVMVKASCEMRASPYEHEEMEFLSTLCEKIRQDSSIILLYIQVFLFFFCISSLANGI